MSFALEGSTPSRGTVFCRIWEKKSSLTKRWQKEGRRSDDYEHAKSTKAKAIKTKMDTAKLRCLSRDAYSSSVVVFRSFSKKLTSMDARRSFCSLCLSFF
ncbi:hypothetical protein KKC00_00735 [Patescibacteria group bacterium]|nr:hypothetical protein [Patescibacteria group bacterium]